VRTSSWRNSSATIPIGCGACAYFPHQQLVNAAAEALPFADKEFDYVICNQVLEHSDDPAQFLREVMRVGKAGYIETHDAASTSRTLP